VDIDIEGAAEALMGGDDVVEDTPVESTPVEEQAVEESFTGLDPSNLPEDLQPLYKNMQADYTRKTQEIAEARKVFEQFNEYGIDPNYALEAVGFLHRLDTDPEFAREVANHLSPTQEQPVAAQQNSEDVVPNNGGDYANLPPELAAELEQMRAFRSEMMEAQEQSEMMAELEAEEAQIRAQYTHYTDDDIERIYNLAYSTDGDLLAAQEIYHQMEQGVLNKYLQSKQVPLGATSPGGAPASVPGQSFANLDDAHKAALEVVRNLQ
jgi:hypothetical protein